MFGTRELLPLRTRMPMRRLAHADQQFPERKHRHEDDRRMGFLIWAWRTVSQEVFVGDHRGGRENQRRRLRDIDYVSHLTL